MKRVNATIISNQEIGKHVHEMVLSGEFGLAEWFCGQFVNVRIPDDSVYLRRPFSIVDAYDDRIVLVYRLEGRGTEIMKDLETGMNLDILSPLGNTFPQVKGKTVALLGGGIGVVPLYGLARKLRALGNDVHSFMGYLDRDSVIYAEQFNAVSTLTIATMDGSEGIHGTALDALGMKPFDVLFACGPQGMLRAIDAKFPEQEVYLSLEARMACGFGVCNACTCAKRNDPGKTSLICKDGPVFKGGSVVL